MFYGFDKIQNVSFSVDVTLSFLAQIKTKKGNIYSYLCHIYSAYSINNFLFPSFWPWLAAGGSMSLGGQQSRCTTNR